MNDETPENPKEKPARKRKVATKTADAPRKKTAKPETAPSGETQEREPEKAPVAAKSPRRVAGAAEKSAPAKPERYFEGVGRRKTAVARVRLFTRPGDLVVNDRPHTVYFPTIELQKIVEDAMQKMKLWGKFKVTAKISGGGIHAQAEAFRHGLSRCLTKFNPDFRKRLRRAGFLTRDPRMKERKKPGLKKARRAPQWRKR